jgi:ribonuclease P protein component
MSDTKFPRSSRLSGRHDLERVKKEGRRRALPELVLFFLPGQPVTRIAVAADRRVGGAVARNRHRRKLKEFYRLNKSLFPDGHFFYLLVRSPISDWKEFEQRFKKLLGEI